MELANRSIMIMGRTPYTKLDATSAAPAWDSTATYAVGTKVTYKGRLYEANTSTSGDAPGTDASWTDVTLVNLFLALSGGTMTGPLTAPEMIATDDPDSSQAVAGVAMFGRTKIWVEWANGERNIFNFPHKDNNTVTTFATLLDIPGPDNTKLDSEAAAPDYDSTATYAEGEYVTYLGKLYYAKQAITTAEDWTAAHWTEATVEDVLAAIRSALDNKAPLASPAFTGTPTAPNLTDQSADGQVANKKYVDDKVAGVSVTPLSGQTFDFATMQGIFAGVKACIEALGGSVTNFPAIPANE